jgi:peptidoglycan hydrolase-like protein with peptidoglycan-binding domain
MRKERFIVWALVCSGLLLLGACSSRGERRAARTGQTSARSSAATGQATGAQLSSAQITQVQQALKAKGYDPGSTDGVMGTQTQEALRKFQQANGLQPTGTVDSRTAKALGISMSESSSTGQDRSSSTTGSPTSQSSDRGSGSSATTGSSGSRGGSSSSSGGMGSTGGSSSGSSGGGSGGSGGGSH